jgi:ADP-ribosylglycohydrolase
MHPMLEILTRAVEADIAQMIEEGHDQTALSKELEQAKATGSIDAVARLQEDLWNRPSPSGFGYDEPSDWKTISATFPQADSHARFEGSDEDLADRLLAAWEGRCAGCQLGKPIEGTTWPDKIRQVLEIVGSWPLEDYMNPTPEGMEVEQLPDCDFFQRNMAWRNTLCKGQFDHVAPDDDIHYALVSQLLLEKHGSEFTSDDALTNLQQHMYDSSLYASGRHAFRTSLFGVPGPYVAILGNPCRQSLGSQIRCDAFGWGAPGNPALAAEMAYKDAANSQTRNGIYSGVFFAVLMADALAQGDAVAAIETAASYVPPKSRFAEMIRLVRSWCEEMDQWEDVNAAILERWPEESRRFNHSIPNAAIVLTGLLKGEGDFTRTLGITVMCGLDTDCTGATVGSILGCALGTRGVPRHWIDPFNDTIRSEVKGMKEVKITEIAKRMFEVARKNARR